MTQTRYITTEHFPFKGKFVQPSTNFTAEELGLSADDIKRFEGVYFLSEKEYARRNNPTAHRAQTELEQAQARIQELTAQLAQAGGNGDKQDLTPLLELFKNEAGELPTFDQAVATIKTVQGQLASLRMLVQPVGEASALPGNFLRRGSLSPLGLETYESLRGKSVAQLASIDGINEQEAADILAKVDAFFAKQSGPKE